jgi:Divergent InlB B-repeat domain
LAFAAAVVLVWPIGAPAREDHRLACTGPPTIDSLTESASTSATITLAYLWTTSSATGNTFDLTLASQDVHGTNYPNTGQWNGSHVFANLAAGTSYQATMGISNPCGKASQSIQASTSSSGTSSTTTSSTTTAGGSGEPEVNISFAGTGTGSVFLSWTRQASGSIGEECPSSARTCSFPLAAGTSVTFQARPASGSSFAGWDPTTACTGTQCTLTLTSTQSYQATFTPGSSPTPTPAASRHELTVLVVGTGSGTVIASWTRQSSGSIGEVCTRRDARCGFGLVSTTRVELVARAASGSRFVSWRPPAGCDAYACSFSILSGSLTYTADFALLPRCRLGARSTRAHPCRSH